MRVPAGEIWLADGVAYKFVIEDSNNVLIGTYDNIIGINSTFLNYVTQEETQIAAQGQTVFTLATTTYTPGTNSLNVFVNGSKQISSVNYIETDSTTVTFASGLNVGDIVDFTTAASLSSGVVSASNTIFVGTKGQIGVVQNIANPTGSDWLGFQQNGTGATSSGYSVQDKLRQTLSVADFGAVGDNVTDDTAAIQAALNATPDYGTLNFVEGKTYKTTSAITINPGAIGVVIQGNGARIRAAHNGDGLVLISYNDNYSRHSVYNLTLIGPNVIYPANPTELAGTSTGAGISMGRNTNDETPAAYSNHFYNVNISQFKIGYYLQNALLCSFYGGYISWNRFGIFVEGGQTNANSFFGLSIRQNTYSGLTSEHNYAALSYSSKNVFYGGIFESNIPYDLATYGGYNPAFDGSGVGCAVQLLGHDQNWSFNNVYFENHNYSLFLNTADYCLFNDCWLAETSPRPGGIYMGSCQGNTFKGNYWVGIATTANITFDGTTQPYNNFTSNAGFIFPISTIPQYTNISNGIQNIIPTGQLYGTIQMPVQGLSQNPLEGTTPGTITGIGTSTATLNTFGFGEVFFDTSITANTTITTVYGAQAGQILVLTNNQSSHNLILKSAGAIFLKSGVDVTFSAANQTMMLYINYQGRAYEIGRNF